MKVTRSKAFTLVELLAVIAIIFVLIAILVPAVQGAWELVIMAQCRNNIHQLLIGLQRYAADNDGRLPESDASWTSPNRSWLGWGRADTSILDVPHHGSIFTYVPNERVYLCPTQEYCPLGDMEPHPFWNYTHLPPGFDEDNPLSNGRFTYAMPELVGSAPVALLSKANVKYMMLDGTVKTIPTIILVEACNPGHMFWLKAPGWRTGEAVLPAHFGGSNVGLIDGSVEWLDVQNIYWAGEVGSSLQLYLFCCSPERILSYGGMSNPWFGYSSGALDAWCAGESIAGAPPYAGEVLPSALPWN